MESFEDMLKGGHSNSLGRTVEVVEEVLKENGRFDELFGCYFSDDEVVRLRVSNAMKRIAKAQKELLIPYMDRLLEEISKIDQASAQWTLSQLFLIYQKDLNSIQKAKAQFIMMNNIEHHNDWIVLSQTTETLTKWAKKDLGLQAWLMPHLERLAHDPRKSVAKKANKALETLA